MPKTAKKPGSRRWGEAAAGYEKFSGGARNLVLCAAGLLVLTFAAYLPVLRAGFIWDDPDYVENNLTLRTAGGLVDIWVHPKMLPQYYPLVHTTYWVEYHLWGLNPVGYHVDNVLLHAANAVLAWLVLRRLQVPGALLAAALFAVHPVHVESVAWVTERKNVLSGFFYLAAMLVYLRAFPPLPRGEGGGEGEFDRKAYVAALLLFVCALLSKTVTCSLPAALILILWWKRGRLTPREVLPTLPMFVVGAIAASYTGYLERHHVGASGPEWDLSFVHRCYVAGKALWFYAGKLLLPVRLSFVYSRWDVSRLGVWRAVVPLFAYAAVVGVLFLARRRAGRGPVTAALLFAGTLLPALGFVNVFPMRYTFAADHYQYLASIALLAIVAAGLWRGSRSPMLHSSLFILPLLLAPLTFARCEVFQNREALWRDTLAKDPDSWVAHTNLGHVLVEQKRYGEAFEEYRRALELRPDLPESHRNFGAALAERGRYGEAIGEYEAALRLQPNYAEAYYGLGLVYAAEGKADEALGMYRKTLEIEPAYPQAHYNLAVALEREGKMEEAIEHYRAALASRPDYAAAHYNLGNCYLTQRRPAEAAAELAEVIRLRPDWAEAHANLGAAYLMMGNSDAAAAEYDTARQINPNLGRSGVAPNSP